MKTKNTQPARFFLFLLFSTLVALALSGFSLFSPSWQSINLSIYENYPEVKSIGTEELVQIMGKENFLLVDVRDAEEFAVSSIAGAVNIQSADKIETENNKKIIVFCSVGLRSAKFARQLLKAGYTEVYNLRGSLFEWANKGYPLFQGTRETHAVHPYSQRWGKLLDKDLHSYHPLFP